MTTMMLPDLDELLAHVRTALGKDFYTADIVERGSVWSFTTLAETPAQALANIRAQPFCEGVNCLHVGFGHDTPDLLQVALAAQVVTCALCGKALEYAEQFECSTCDRTVCRECSNNQHTLSPAIRCKLCLPTELVACEACGEQFKPAEGYYEAEHEPTYSYCAQYCHW